MQRFSGTVSQILGTYRRLWLSLWGAKLVFALVVTLPVLVLIQSKLDHSLFAKNLLGEWSLDVLFELIFTNENLLTSSVLFMLAIALLGFLFKQFLNGGLYDCLVRQEPPERERFFSQSSSMFLQHLAISAWMLFVYLLLFLTAGFLGEMISSLARKLIPSLDLTRLIVRIAVTYFVLIIGVVFSDLVRIHRTRAVLAETVNGTRGELGLSGIGQSFKAAYLIIASRGFAVLWVYLQYFLPFVLVWLAIEGMALVVTGAMSNLLGAAIEFVLFQICALVRTGQSLAGTLAMTAFVPQPEPKPMLEETSDQSPVLS